MKTILKIVGLVLFLAFLVFAFGYISIELRTNAHKDSLEKTFKQTGLSGDMIYFKVFEYDENQDTSKVFAVEDVRDIKTGESYEAGRMYDLKFDPAVETWKVLKWEEYWSGKKKSGNRVTFPPYLGSDKMIWMKK